MGSIIAYTLMVQGYRAARTSKACRQQPRRQAAQQPGITRLNKSTSSQTPALPLSLPPSPYVLQGHSSGGRRRPPPHWRGRRQSRPGCRPPKRRSDRCARNILPRLLVSPSPPSFVLRRGGSRRTLATCGVIITGDLDRRGLIKRQRAKGVSDNVLTYSTRLKGKDKVA